MINFNSILTFEEFKGLVSRVDINLSNVIFDIQRKNVIFEDLRIIMNDNLFVDFLEIGDQPKYEDLLNGSNFTYEDEEGKIINSFYVGLKKTIASLIELRIVANSRFELTNAGSTSQTGGNNASYEFKKTKLKEAEILGGINLELVYFYGYLEGNKATIPEFSETPEEIFFRKVFWSVNVH